MNKSILISCIIGLSVSGCSIFEKKEDTNLEVYKELQELKIAQAEQEIDEALKVFSKHANEGLSTSKLYVSERIAYQDCMFPQGYTITVNSLKLLKNHNPERFELCKSEIDKYFFERMDPRFKETKSQSNVVDSYKNSIIYIEF